MDKTPSCLNCAYFDRENLQCRRTTKSWKSMFGIENLSDKDALKEAKWCGCEAITFTISDRRTFEYGKPADHIWTGEEIFSLAERLTQFMTKAYPNGYSENFRSLGQGIGHTIEIMSGEKECRKLLDQLSNYVIQRRTCKDVEWEMGLGLPKATVVKMVSDLKSFDNYRGYEHNFVKNASVKRRY